MSETYNFCKDVDERISREVDAIAEELGVGPGEVMVRALAAMRGFSSTSDVRVANNSTRQTYRFLSDDKKARVDRIKQLGAEFITLCHEIGGTDPEEERLASRDLSPAVTHAEDAVMRAVRHVTK